MSNGGDRKQRNEMIWPALPVDKTGWPGRWCICQAPILLDISISIAATGSIAEAGLPALSGPHSPPLAQLLWSLAHGSTEV